VFLPPSSMADLGSWAETNHVPLESASPSRRDSVLSTASPTDTDTDTGVDPCTGNGSGIDNRTGRVIISHSHSPGLENQPCSTPMMPSSSDGWQSALGDSDDAGSSRKASVYLDANDGPSVAEIMRELRELPEPGSASGTSGASPSRQATPSTTPHSPANLDHTPALGELSFSSPRASAFSTLPASLPALLQPQSSQPLPPAITTSSPSTLPSRLVRRRERSPIRHSFSSFVRPPSITRPPARGRDGSDIEAVVELHEESASAFQDFLFWAYPHLECKVTWGNVENVSTVCIAGFRLGLGMHSKPLRPIADSAATRARRETARSTTAKIVRTLPHDPRVGQTRHGPCTGGAARQCRAVPRGQSFRP
jgi:hypothetical protein